MHMNKENKLSPELRFPEFHKDNGWNVTKISDVLDYEQPTNYLVKDTNYSKEGTAVLTANKSFILGYTNENQSVYKNIPAIIFDDFTVDNKFVNFPFKVKSSAIKILKNKKESDSLKFIYELMQQIKIDAAEHKRYYISSYQNLDILFPSNPKEQQKIADCLSSLDEIITLEEQKLTALEEHKKGLMQNLFPQEGEMVPKYRFPEFINDFNWHNTSIEDNCLLKGRIGYRGYTTNDLVERGKGVIVIGGKHIKNHILNLTDPTYLSWEKYYESPEIMVELGDIIFSQRGTLGDCAIIDIEIGSATINPSMVLMKNISCNAKFLYYTLIGESIQNEVNKSKALGAIPMISQKQIKEFTFLIPSPEEQQKIAECLSSIDEIISQQQNKIEQLKEHKRGLTQGLFPKIE